MELQARVRIWGRPRGRSGPTEYLVSSPYIARENARVGAGSEIPEINYTPQPIVPERLTYIGVKLVDQDGEPVERSRVRVKLPDGDIREGRTDRDGELMIKGFALDGIAEIELLDFVEALPEAATAEDEEVATEEVAAAEELLTEEKEFVVKVVDETGKGVSGVSLVFSGAGTSKTVPTDGGGVAKWKAAADSVEVTFESAEAVVTTMTPVWLSRSASALEKAVSPSQAIALVVGRGTGIETADGQAFGPLSLQSGNAQALQLQPAGSHSFEFHLVDEIGEAVVNASVNMRCGAAQYDLKTDSSGQVRLAGQAEQYASVQVTGIDDLKKSLAAKWSAIRSDPMVEANETTTVAVLSDDLGPTALETNQPYTLSLRPNVVKASHQSAPPGALLT